MPGAPVEARLAYEYEFEAAQGWSLEETGMAYALPWEYSLGPRGPRLVLSLCPGSAALVEPLGAGRVRVRVYAAPGSRCWEEAAGRVPWALGASEDYSAFHEMARRDPLAGCVPRLLPGWRLRSPNPWQAVLTAIAQQNTGFLQGWGMLRRLYEASGPRLLVEGRVFIEPPWPGPGLGEAARASGWGYRARYLEAAAEAAGSRGEAPVLGGCSLLEAVHSAKGMGPYSRSLTLLLACRRYDALPLDRWLARLAARAYGVPEGEAAAEISRRFPGFEGLAALAATICCDAEPIGRALERLESGRCLPGYSYRALSPLTLWRG